MKSLNECSSRGMAFAREIEFLNSLIQINHLKSSIDPNSRIPQRSLSSPFQLTQRHLFHITIPCDIWFEMTIRGLKEAFLLFDFCSIETKWTKSPANWDFKGILREQSFHLKGDRVPKSIEHSSAIDKNGPEQGQLSRNSVTYGSWDLGYRFSELCLQYTAFVSVT